MFRLLFVVVIFVVVVVVVVLVLVVFVFVDVVVIVVVVKFRAVLIINPDKVDICQVPLISLEPLNSQKYAKKCV